MLQPTDFNPRVINAITTILNQGYECELKYAGGNLIVIKIKRKLLYKVAKQSDIKDYLIDNLMEQLNTTQDVKIEFKREREKTAIVLVKKTETIRSKGTE